MEPRRQGWSVPLDFLSVSKPAWFSLVWIFTYAALTACNILPAPSSGLTWEVSSSRKPSLNLHLWFCVPPLCFHITHALLSRILPHLVLTVYWLVSLTNLFSTGQKPMDGFSYQQFWVWLKSKVYAEVGVTWGCCWARGLCRYGESREGSLDGSPKQGLESWSRYWEQNDWARTMRTVRMGSVAKKEEPLDEHLRQGTWYWM